MRQAFWAVMAAATMAAGCADQPSGHHAPITDHSVSATAQPAPDRSGTDDSGTGNSGTGSSRTGDAGRGESPARAQPDHAAQMDKDWRPQVYKVQAGDTLYGIAFNFGLDYHELAEINNISDPTVIHPGQEIRLFPAAGVADTGAVPIKDQPLVVKLPYSEQAVAQVEKAQTAQTGQAAHSATGTKQGGVVVTAGIAPGGVPVQWEMPTSGKVVAGFSEADNRKGVDIAGKLGQPIYASAPGKVIFCGSGLRGYGKLIIIKHNDTYLSAYAHNDKLLVKEGQMVSRGQMIAQMGSTDADRVALHFEIRKLGKPVDPAKYLVFPKS